MRRTIFIVLIDIIFFILQVTVLDFLKVFNVKPDILFVAVIFFNIYFAFKWGIFSSILFGFTKDIFSVGYFGVNIFVFVICAFIIRLIKRQVYKKDVFTRAAFVFSLSLINGILYVIATAIAGSGQIPFSFKIIFLESLYNALLASVIFIFLKQCVLKYSV